MDKTHLHKIIAWTLVLVWMGVIFYLSHQAGGASSELSSGLVDIVYRILSGLLPFISIDVDLLHFTVRKFAHFTAYFILGVFILHALVVNREITVKILLASFLFTVVYAISDEVHQLFIPGRSGEVRDVLIDSSGSLLGICLYAMMRRLILRWKGRL